MLVELELLPDVEVSELVEVLESDELEVEVLESEVLVEDGVEEEALELTSCSELALLASESAPLQAACDGNTCKQCGYFAGNEDW